MMEYVTETLARNLRISIMWSPLLKPPPATTYLQLYHASLGLHYIRSKRSIRLEFFTRVTHC